MRTKSCLYVSNWNLGIKGCKCSRCRSCCVAMDKNNIWATLLKYITKACKNSCCNVSKILSLLHDIQVIVWLNIKDSQYLVKHFTVLTCHTYDSIKFIRTLLELLNQRTHLDSFWTCSKNQHYFLYHILNLLLG